MNTEYVIVLGCPRSGTTYLMSVLNALPHAECMNGTLLPVTIPHVVNQNLRDDVYDALAVGFERALDDYLHSGRYHSRAAAVQNWFAAPTGLKGLLRAAQGRRSEPRWMIYKEPFLSLAPEFVLKAFPASKIIYIYRDGRDVANSLVKSYDVLTDEKLTHLRSAEMRLGRKYDHRYVPWWVEEGQEVHFLNSSPYVRSIWMWKYMVRRCHDVFSHPDVQASGRVISVQYEELVRSPQEQGKRLLSHLGGKVTAAMQKRLEAAHSSSIGKHKRRNAAEIKAAEEAAGDELLLHGYLTPKKSVVGQ